MIRQSTQQRMRCFLGHLRFFLVFAAFMVWVRVTIMIMPAGSYPGWTGHFLGIFWISGFFWLPALWEWLNKPRKYDHVLGSIQ